MGKTPIEWATHTENWLAGCTKVSPACTHCYAETMTARLETMPHAPDRYRDGVIKDRRWTGRISYSVVPMLVMFQELATATKPRCVFCNSMSDTFHANVPAESLTDLADQIETWDRCWWRTDSGCERADAVGEEISTMERRTRGRKSVIMLLTKRPDRMLAWQREYFPDGLPSWVWVGCTVEDQRRANERVPVLVKVDATVRFLSCEPLLGPVNLDFIASDGLGKPGYHFSALQVFPPNNNNGISWLIAGGESGPKARPTHPDWLRSLRDQCAEAGVPFMFKQWGAWVSDLDKPCRTDLRIASWVAPDGSTGNTQPQPPGAAWGANLGKHKSGRTLDGITHDGFPEVDDG